MTATPGRLCEALPHRVRGSRMVTLRGVTPRSAACRSIASSILERASSRSQASTTAASGRASADARWMTSSSSNRITVDRRAPVTAGTTRIGTTEPSSRMDPPSRAPPRAAKHGTDVRVPGEVATDPRLTLFEELHGPSLAVGSSGARGGHGDDHASFGVDHDAQAAGAGRMPKGVSERPAREWRDRRHLRGRRKGRPAASRHPVRRSSRPARSPVSCPASTAGRPFTTTCSMPMG